MSSRASAASPSERRAPSQRLFDLCLEEKLITRGFFGHNSTSFAPSLTITRSQVDDVIDRFSRGLDKLTAGLKTEFGFTPAG